MHRTKNRPETPRIWALLSRHGDARQRAPCFLFITHKKLPDCPVVEHTNAPWVLQYAVTNIFVFLEKIMAQADMHGKICLVTGSTSGIGKATALGLAKLGATVVMVSRDKARGEAARSEIQTKSGNDSLDLLLADLASQASIRQLAQDFRQKYSNLDVLVNNAGISPTKR